jgi:hypothetical protein
MFKNYVSTIMGGRPFQPMFSPDGGGGGPQDPPPTDPPADPPNDPPADPPEDPVKFDDKQQAEIQKIINATIAKERKKAEKAAADAAAEAERKAKMTAEEKAEAERKEREEAAQKREAKANERIVNLEIKDVARELGVSSQKMDRFLKVVDRDDLKIDEDGNVERSAVEAAVKAVLADMPEFKGSTSSKGPGADFGGQQGGAKYTLAQIQGMSAKEIAADYDEVQKSMRIHQKQ